MDATGGIGRRLNVRLPPRLIWHRLVIGSFCVVFVGVFVAALVSTFSAMRLYEGMATIKVRGSSSGPYRDSGPYPGYPGPYSPVPDVKPADKLQELQSAMRASPELVRQVVARLDASERLALVAPFATRADGPNLTTEQVLAANYRVVPRRLTLLMGITSRHPNRLLAAKVANLFAETLVANWKEKEGQRTRVWDELQAAVDLQQKKTKELAQALHDLTLDIPNRADQNPLEVRIRAKMVADAQAMLDGAEAKVGQLAIWRKSGRELHAMPLIASQGLIAGLDQEVADERGEIDQFESRAMSNSPIVAKAAVAPLEAAKTKLAELEAQRRGAAENFASSIEADFDNARHNLEDAKTHLGEANDLAQELERATANYDELHHQFDESQASLKRMREDLDRMSQPAPDGTDPAFPAFSFRGTLRIIDRAVPPAEGDYVSPNHTREVGLGFLQALGWAAGSAGMFAALGWWTDRGRVG